MSGGKFIAVKLTEWDSSKVTIGIQGTDKAASPTVLYEGKVPIITLAGDGVQSKYVVSSYDGLKKNMKYDQAKRGPSEIWEGDWQISFKVADSYDSATALQKKIIDIFDDIVNKAKRFYKKDPGAQPVSVKRIVEMTPQGEEDKGPDPSKPVYLKVKVGHDADKGAPTFTDTMGKQVPVLEARFPKADFYDITRDKKSMAIDKKAAGIECNTGMFAVPKIMISLYKLPGISGAYYITRRLMQCYYEPAEMKAGGMDDDLVNSLREMDLQPTY